HARDPSLHERRSQAELWIPVTSTGMTPACLIAPAAEPASQAGRSGEGAAVAPLRRTRGPFRQPYGFLGCPYERLGFVDALLLLVLGNRIVDESRARLDVHDAVFDDRGTQDDAGVH